MLAKPKYKNLINNFVSQEARNMCPITYEKPIVVQIN